MGGKSLIKFFLRQVSDRFLKLGVLALSFEVKRLNASRLLESSGGQAVSGPFQGVTLLKQTKWSSSQEVFGQAIGTFEVPVSKVLTERVWDAFVDIGAESGFYVASMLGAKHCKKAYAFEIDQTSRTEMMRRLELNKVSAEIRGMADPDSVLELIRTEDLNRQDTVVLCDIEGGEFQLFSDELIKNLTQCTMVIELHDREGKMIDQLLERLSHTHFTEIRLRDEWHAPYLSSPSLDHLSDHEKMILISEGRSFSQKWLVARPRKIL